MDAGEGLRKAIKDAFSRDTAAPEAAFTALYRVEATAYRPTGNTVHYRNGEPCPEPHSLVIGRFDTAEGVYLLRLDDEGDEITDTWHESVNDAFEQARFEFGIPNESWARCS
jgi:hypothetical protein